jgi:hypothetical protein
MPGGWQGSTRLNTLPDNWPHLRAQRRHIAEGRCEWIKANGARCNRPCWDDGECDHAVHRNDHRIESLRWLCKTHHGRKSSREGNDAHRERPSRLRPAEVHPGVIARGVGGASPSPRRGIGRP